MLLVPGSGAMSGSVDISSDMSTDITFFHTKASQTEPNGSFEVRMPSGTLHMRFTYEKRIGSRRLDTQGDIAYDAPIVLDRRGVVFDPSDFLSERVNYTWMLRELISSKMPSVREHEHSDIIGNIIDAVEVAVPGLIIDFLIVYTTVRLLGCARTDEEYHKIVDEVTMEFFHIAKRIVGTKLSIDGMEKVILDSLDLTVRQTPCIICREDLDHIDAIEDKLFHPPSVTRLPCSHLYHEDCILKWLRIGHLCPLCRCPIQVVRVPCGLASFEGVDERIIGETTGEQQIVEVEREGPVAEVRDDQPPIVNVAGEQLHLEVTNQSLITSFQVDWPVLLNMSAGGIIAAMLLCRLLK